MRKFNCSEEIIKADTDKKVVKLALESGLFSVKVGCSEFSNIGLDEEGATDHFWGFDDYFFGDKIGDMCWDLDIIREAKEKDNPKEFLKEEEKYNRVIGLAGSFDVHSAYKKLKKRINKELDDPEILKIALEHFDHLESQYIKKILDNLNIDYQIID